MFLLPGRLEIIEFQTRVALSGGSEKYASEECKNIYAGGHVQKNFQEGKDQTVSRGEYYRRIILWVKTWAFALQELRGTNLYVRNLLIIILVYSI